MQSRYCQLAEDSERRSHINWGVAMSSGDEDADDVRLVASARERAVLPPGLMAAMSVASRGANALIIYPARLIPQHMSERADSITPRPLSLEIALDTPEGRTYPAVQPVSDGAVGQAQLDLCSGRWISVRNLCNSGWH